MVLKKNLLALFILLGLGLFAMRTFYGPHYFDGHDAQAHLVRLYQYDLALKDGQILPQWAGGLLAGRGYPVFIFAYPLPYLIAESFHLVGFSLAVAIKLTFALSYLVSLVGMYFLAGFTGAILWGFAPYMFVKIFITASLGEVVSYAVIPWFFLSLKRRNYLLLSLTLALWILSHPATLVIFSPLILLFFLTHLKNYRQLLLSFLLGLGLSAWYFIPANLELGYTHFKEFVSTQYVNDFVPFARLLYSKWGTNAPGWGVNPLSQQVGIAQWLAICFGFIYWRKLWPYLLSFGVSIFLMLSISKPIWDLPTLLQSVSTPWRFLSLAVFSAALAGGLVIKQIRSYWLRITVSGLLIFLALYGNRNHLRINDIRDYDKIFLENYIGVATGWNEYLPIWIKDTPHEFPQNKLEVLTGNCQINYPTVKCLIPSTLQLNTAYFPGWQVKANDQDLIEEIKANLDSSSGMMQFSLDPGEYKISAKFSDTPLRRFSKIISLFTLAGLIIFYFQPRFFSLLRLRLAGLFPSCAGKTVGKLSVRRSNKRWGNH